MSASYAHVAAAQSRRIPSRELASDQSQPPDAKPPPAPQHTRNAPSRRRAAQGSSSSFSYTSYYGPTAAAHHGHDAPPSPPSSPVLVLTLRTGPPALEAHLSAQRQRWFPPARLRVPDAHVTVFHALPAGDAAVPAALTRAAAALPPRVPLRLGPAFRLGRQGVAVGVLDAAEVLGRARRRLLREWLAGGPDAAVVALSAQDRRVGWRPHYTLLNKEGDAARVDACLAAAAADQEAAAADEGWANGFVLWRYERDGRWTWVREFGFGEGAPGEGRKEQEEKKEGGS